MKQELLLQVFLHLVLNVMMPRRRNITERFKACSDGGSKRLFPMPYTTVEWYEVWIKAILVHVSITN
jgi:hypothetical protein